MGRRQLFIYWRVAAADLPATMQAARDLQGRLRLRHPGLCAGLYLRSDSAASDATLMETYGLESGDGVDAVLQQHIEEAGAAALAPWLFGARHVEVFDACDG
ncbi:MAG: DUF4936 family protein [Rubrivivax sp.]